MSETAFTKDQKEAYQQRIHEKGPFSHMEQRATSETALKGSKEQKEAYEYLCNKYNEFTGKVPSLTWTDEQLITAVVEHAVEKCEKTVQAEAAAQQAVSAIPEVELKFILPSWKNWNGNQRTNATVVSPDTLSGLQEAVKKSANVRVAGYGHSWSPIVATIHEPSSTTLIQTKGSFCNILSSPADVRAKGNITIEPGVSVEKLEKWLESYHIDLTIGSNVVLTEVYMVAVATSLCHGAGYEWGSVADMILAISIVDANGKLTTYTDVDKDTLAILPDSPLAANIQRVDTTTMNHYRGTLGLLGAIYAITLKLEKSVTLEMTDTLVPVSEFLDADKMKSRVEAVNGWIEVFWVPGAPNVWVKSWKRAPGATATIPNTRIWDKLTTITAKFSFEIQKFIKRWGLNFPGKKEISHLLMKITYEAMVLLIKPETKHYYSWYNALHYRNFLDDMRVEDTEFAFPVESDNYKKAADAFQILHDAIQKRAEKGDYPVDLTCEMRFTGGSNATLAHYPARVSKKWVHVEFLSYNVQGAPVLERRWNQFVLEIAKEWQRIGSYPHWAKGWHDIPGIHEHFHSFPGVQAFNQFRKAEDPSGKFLNAELAKIFKHN